MTDELPEWIKVGEPVAVDWGREHLTTGTVIRLTPTMIVVARTGHPARRFRRDKLREVGDRPAHRLPGLLVDPRAARTVAILNRADADTSIAAIDALAVSLGNGADPLAVMGKAAMLAEDSHRRIAQRIAGEFVPLPSD